MKSNERLESIAEITCSSSATDMNSSASICPTGMESVQSPPKQAGVGLILQIIEGQGLIVQGLAKSLLLEEEQRLVEMGDMVESIDGMSIVGWKLRDVNPLLLGDPCSLVTLGILRGNKERTFVTLTRLCPAPGTQSSMRTSSAASGTSSVASDLEKFRLSLQQQTYSASRSPYPPPKSAVSDPGSPHVAATRSPERAPELESRKKEQYSLDGAHAHTLPSLESTTNVGRHHQTSSMSSSSQPGRGVVEYMADASHTEQAYVNSPDRRWTSSHDVHGTDGYQMGSSSSLHESKSSEKQHHTLSSSSGQTTTVSPHAMREIEREQSFAMDDRQTSIRALASNPQRAQVLHVHTQAHACIFFVASKHCMVNMLLASTCSRMLRENMCFSHVFSDALS
jgi:hypothetical protein